MHFSACVEGAAVGNILQNDEAGTCISHHEPSVSVLKGFPALIVRCTKDGPAIESLDALLACCEQKPLDPLPCWHNLFAECHDPA